MATTDRLNQLNLKMGPPRGGGGRRGAAITWAGAVYLAALGVITLAALNASVNLLFLVIGLAVGVLVVSVVAANGAIRKLEITRQAPDAVVAGRPFSIRYRVSNNRSRQAAALRIRDRFIYGSQRMRIEGFIAAAPPGGVATLDVPVIAPGRGRIRFDAMRLATRVPFGLFERRMTVAAPHETMVYPSLLPLRRRFEGRSMMAAAAQAREARAEKHGADEFYGLREYRHGDNLKHIHWRRSARTRQLLVREMVDLKPQSVIIVLDTHLPPGTSETHREAAISAAGTLLCHALERGYRVALIVLAANPVVIPPTSGRGLRARLMGHLAEISGPSPQPAPAFLEGLHWRGHWRGRCLMVAPVGYPGFWEAANFVRQRATTLELVTTIGPEFAGWFGVTPEQAGIAEGAGAAAPAGEAKEPVGAVA